jgi:transcription elongation factor Elf1
MMSERLKNRTGYGWEMTADCSKCGESGSVQMANDMNDLECGNCGQWFNYVGQTLIPPRQWGEETGERFGDHGEYLGGGYD